jgi:uncharacterized protein (TIGR03382 family)
VGGVCVTDGGVTDGGVTDGGVTDGGATDGGTGPIVRGEAPSLAECGTPYRFQLTAQGEAPFRFILVEGPEGMTVDETTGLVEWMPLRLQAGRHDIVLRVEDARGATEWRATVDASCTPKSYRVGCSCTADAAGLEALAAALLWGGIVRRRRAGASAPRHGG